MNEVRTIPLKQENKPWKTEKETLGMKKPLLCVLVLNDTHSRWTEITLLKS